jgi:hypothetical protein
MKLILTSLTILFGCISLSAQQYYEDTYVDTTLYGANYPANGNCILPDVVSEITLDTSLYDYVTGLQFIVVVDTSTGVLLGGVSVGDTIELTAGSPTISFGFGSLDASVQYHVAVIGTPSVVNQSYPCQLELIHCTCSCPFTTIIQAGQFSPTCQVDMATEVNEAVYWNNLPIYPNPTTGQVRIDLGQILDNTTLNIYNPVGSLVHTQQLNGVQYIDHELHGAKGIYLLQLVDQDGNTANNKLIKE